MKNIKITINNPNDYIRVEQLVQFSAPIPRGEIFSCDVVSLFCEKNEKLQTRFVILAFWDDDSIKWLKTTTWLSLESKQQLDLRLTWVESNIKNPQKKQLIQTKTDQSIARLLSSVKCRVLFEDEDNVKYSAALNEGDCDDLSFSSTAFPKNNANQALTANVMFDVEPMDDSSKCYRLRICLHNPKSASHPGGLWDLGDKNSLYFKRFSVSLALINTENVLFGVENLLANEPLIERKNQIFIKQHASGGENWNSRNHINYTGSVCIPRNGFQLNSDTQSQFGQRIQPIVRLSGEKHSLAVSVANFWQNFPSAISTKNDTLQIELFPEGKELHELQGGERKTFEIYVDTQGESKNIKQFLQPISVVVDRTHMASTRAILGLETVYEEDTLYQLINLGIDSDNNFFAKREKIDEYGWRNFGDLFADHETFGNQGSNVVISHYNNQYDPIFGFLRQYLNTGEQRWFELADDLAKHVVDIDIYHTTRDREEYNQGLFWHTDHYCDAATCTHRTFSKQHSAAYQGYSSGGGPGGQHCYSSGLALHYFVTGNQSSKAAVIELAHWITNLYEGSSTILGRLTALKKSKAIGFKNLFTGTYPLDRGTGNYVVALLDAYSVTQDVSYKEQAFSVISQTLHPADDISQFGFSDIEGTWFYTILLQCVIRYLELKRSENQLDESFYYCRDVLLQYASWIEKNEQPYLEQIEKLEFPNQTWTAQDLRKANIMYAAYFYSGNTIDQYKVKAELFYQYVIDQLKDDPANTQTRIQVLLMQNIGAKGFYLSEDNITFLPSKRWPERTLLSKSAVICKELFRAIKSLSIKNEIDWLRVRSMKVAAWLGEKQ